ncbi:MotE family protein [Lysinibacillus sp. NPDC097231]|uniref:MotE family protein n=1 Tax=Lysinibacillus sp. NPDC097231 TaxID=3364142 RepID=UPI0038151D92
MAKKDNRLTTELAEPQSKRKSGGLLKFFTWIVLPIMTVVAVLLVVATLMNTNVFDLGKKAIGSLPFVPSEEQQAKDAVVNNDSKMVKLQAEMQEKEAEIAQLQKKLETTITEKDKLATEKEQLQFEIEKLNREQDQVKRDFTDILSTFDKMSPKAAAPVLIKMSDTEALRILTNLKPDKLAAILEKMSPQDAAKYTEMMTKQ